MVVSIALVIAGTPAAERTVQISTSVTKHHAIPAQLAPTMKAPTVAVANQDSVEMEIPVLTSTSVIITPAT